MDAVIHRNLLGSPLSVFFVAFLFLAGMEWSPAALCKAAEPQEKGILFRWACVAMTSKDGEAKREKVTHRTALKTGDQIKMFLEFKKKAFVYVIYQNAKGELRLLFPYRFYGPDSEVNLGQPYYIPGGDAWLMLDAPSGEESIFLLVSTKRPIRLEELVGEYQTSGAARKLELAKEVLKEIQSLRQKNRDLSASAERPITMAGRVRGLKDLPESIYPDVAAFADEISTADFFARTIIIDHK